MSVEQDIKEIIVQTLSVKPEEIETDKTLYDSLGVDSTEIVDLRVTLEKKFGIKIDSKEITKFNSPSDIINLVESKRSAS